MAMGDPSVAVLDPQDGSVVLSHAYNVTGVARGSDASWFQGSAADFSAGTKDDVAIESIGGLMLARKVSDDFNDDSLDTATWTRTTQGGLNALEESKVLHVKGMFTSGGTWGGWAKVTSASSVSIMVQATLMTFTGGGSGYRTTLMLYQDDSNYVAVGEEHDDAIGSGVHALLLYKMAGVGHFEELGAVTSHPATYRIVVTASNVTIRQNDVVVGVLGMTLSSPKVVITGSAKGAGDSVDTKWDNVLSDFKSAGMLTSSVFDTRSVDPVLRLVEWNSTFDNSTLIQIQLRHGATSDMSSASPWLSVGNGQASDLPLVRRFLQYRAQLSTTDQMDTPFLWNVTFTYNKPVVKVEVIVGDSPTWVLADGTDSWWVVLDLPENSTVIRARATDVAGDITDAYSAVEVDTTPPQGTFTVDGGATSTADREVALALNATDHYGVSKMMVSEREDFSDTIWVPYAARTSYVLSSGEGAKTVFAKLMDDHGLVSAAIPTTIVLDTHAPSGSVSIDGGAAYTGSMNVNLAFNATDPSGVTDVLLGERADLVGAQWASFAPSLDFTLSPSDGTKTVYVAFRDSLGHVSTTTSDSIVLDSIAPSVSIVIAGGATHTGSVQVAIGLAVSEDDRIAYVQMGGDPSLAGASKEPFRASLQWTLPDGDGPKTVYARACDLAGNIGPSSSASIVLDMESPTLVFNIDGGAAFTTSHTVTLTLTASDSSPIGMMEVGSSPDLSGAIMRPFGSPVIFVLPDGEGPRTVYARVTDAAGNIGPTSQVSITVDSIPPVLSVTVQPSGPYTTSRNITLQLAVEDALGASLMQVGEDPSLIGVRPQPFSGSVPWTLSAGDGLKTIYCRVKDLAGNLGDIVSCTIALDTTPPSSGMTPMGNVSGTTDLEVSWGAADATSRVASYDVQYREDDGTWIDLLVGTNATRTTLKGVDGHTYSLRVRSRDVAGNVEEYPEAGLGTILVDVGEPEQGTSMMAPIMIVLIVLIVVVVGVGILLISRRRSR